MAEFAPNVRLFAMGGVQVELEEMFGCSVDLTVPAWLRSHVSESALREAVIVF